MDHSVTIGWTTRALVVYRRESMGAPDPDSHEEPSVPLLPGAAPSNAAWLLPNASSDRAEKILLEKLGNDAAQRALVDRMLKDAESRLS